MRALAPTAETDASSPVEEAIRTRRTHKRFGDRPLGRETIEQLLELARYAPNHHLTQPWRFRVIGPEALARLKEAGGPKEAPKLDRAPTLVVVTARLSGDTLRDEEDILATAAALYAVVLGAHGRGFASYWRTPGVLRTPAGRAAVGIRDGERVLGLLHLGERVSDPRHKERSPVTAYVEFLR